jgi:hypothetical protein
MFLHLIFLLLAIAPSAFASKFRTVQRQNAPFQQVCLLNTSVMVANLPSALACHIDKTMQRVYPQTHPTL